MRKLLFPLFILSGAVLFAQDESSLLARLQAETRALATVADDVVVTIADAPARTTTKSGVANWATALDNGRLVRTGPVAGSLAGVRRTRTATRGSGVLVGSPAKVVFPAGVAGSAATVKVTLPGGAEVEARRIDGDVELGVDVYGLPDDVEARGIPVEGDWSRLARGTLAVQAGNRRGGPLGLTLIQGADARTGRLTVEGGGAGPALVGTNRTLLGLDAPASNWNCGACHTTQHFYVADGSRLVNAFGAYHRAGGACAAGYTAGWTPYVPGPVIRRVLEDVEQHGKIRRGYLGVVLGDSVGKGGVAVTAVLDASPAQEAGFKAGDRIAKVDGIACESGAVVSRVLVLKRPGDTVPFELVRGKETIEASVELADRAEAQQHLVTPETIGLHCVELTAELRGWLGLVDEVQGVLVQKVYGGAVRSGLRRGDVIVWAGGSAVTSVEELGAALAGAKDTLAVRAIRNGTPVSVTVRLPVGGKGKTR